MSETFKCAICKETYDKGLTDEDAAGALKTEFPGFEPDDCDLVCDDCYQIHFAAPNA